MKHLRKSILTFLALTLFGGAGAWAQGPEHVTEFTAELIADWENSTGNVTLEDLQALGFVDTDEETAMAWADAPTTCNSRLIYSTSGTQVKYIKFTNGVYDGKITSEMSQYDLWSMIGGSYKYFYTGAPNQAIELTKVGANQWTLGQTPDYDLELQVEYYEAHALKNIPAGWQVMVNGVDKTAAIAGDSLMIVETDSVTLIPDNPRLVKSVTLADDAPALQTLIIGKGSTQLSGNKELYYITGDTYRQALARPENQSGNGLGWGLWESSTLTTIFFKEVSNKAWDMAIDGDSNFTPGQGSSTITLDSVIDPNHAFQFISTK